MRYSKGYRKGKVNNYQSKILKLWVGKYGILGCWRFDRRYQMLDGMYLHKEWARGDGEIVRHLCSDSKCVNPLHLVRGSDIENAEDEISIRDYSVLVLQEYCNEIYNDKFDNHMCMLILMPRIARASEGRFKTLSEVALYAREKYRECYEGIIAKEKDIDKKLFNYIREKFIYLNSKHYIELITL